MELASQSVFISDDDHMLYGFKESTSSAQWSFGLSTWDQSHLNFIQLVVFILSFS